MYINKNKIKKLVKSIDPQKRVGKDFLMYIDAFIHAKVIKAVHQKNGSKKTLDSTVAAYILGKI